MVSWRSLEEKLQQVRIQFETRVKKYDEKQSEHNTILHLDKKLFQGQERGRAIQKLENDLVLSSNLPQKFKQTIHTAEARTELQNYKIREAEDMGRPLPL